MCFFKNTVLVVSLIACVHQTTVRCMTPRLVIGAESLQGLREYMEDFYHTTNPADAEALGFPLFYSVFDGHSGTEAADYAAHALIPNIIIHNDFWPHDIPAALRSGFITTNEQYTGDAGTTVVTALIRDGILYIANAGDSEALLCHNGTMQQLSQTHQANNPDEAQRIAALMDTEESARPALESVDAGMSKKLHGFRYNQPLFREEPHTALYIENEHGMLSVTRGIGDTYFAPYSTPEPHIVAHPFDGGEEFLILASDGLFESITFEGAVAFVNHLLDLNSWSSQTITQTQALAIARELTTAAFEYGSNDNITVMIIFFRFDSAPAPMPTRQQRFCLARWLCCCPNPE